MEAGVDGRRGQAKRPHEGTTGWNIVQLGSDILERIFSRLQPVSLAHCAAVCTAWRDAITSSLWNSVCLQRSPRLKSLEGNSPSSHTRACGDVDYRIPYAVEEQMDRLRHGRVQLHKWKAHAGRVNSCKMMGEEIVSCSSDKTIRVWSARTLLCEEKYDVGGKDPVLEVDFDEIKVVGAVRRSVLLWNRRGRKRLLRRMRCDSDICTVGIADADVAVGCTDGTVRVFDLYSGRLGKMFRMHAEPVKAVALDTISQTMASGSDDGTVQLFDVNSGQKLASLLRPPSMTGITVMQLSAADQKLFCGSKGGDVYCFDLRTRRPLWKARNLKGAMTCMHGPTYMSSALAVGGMDGTINVFEANTAKSVATFNARSPHYSSPVLGIALGMTKMVSCHADSTMIMWRFAEPRSDCSRSKNLDGRNVTVTFRKG